MGKEVWDKIDRDSLWESRWKRERGKTLSLCFNARAKARQHRPIQRRGKDEKRLWGEN